MVSMWGFTVIFIAIFAVLLVFSVMWLLSDRPDSAGLAPSTPEQQIPDRGAPLVKCAPTRTSRQRRHGELVGSAWPPKREQLSKALAADAGQWASAAKVG